jgi:hypothetical protein
MMSSSETKRPCLDLGRLLTQDGLISYRPAALQPIIRVMKQNYAGHDSKRQPKSVAQPLYQQASPHKPWKLPGVSPPRIFWQAAAFNIL